MLKIQTFTAKTVEEAKALAARTFEVSQDKIEFEILEEPKKGFFGIKKGEARIQASYQTPDVPEAMSENAITDSAPEAMSENAITDSAPEAMSENATADSAPEAMSENATADSAPEVMSENATADSAPEVMSENATADSTPEVMSENATTNSAEEKSSIQPDEALVTGEPSASALLKIEKAKEYLTQILSAMDIQAELKVSAGSDSAIIEIVTTNSGAVIGKRGETLDSLQYLTFMTANRTDKEYYRIILNTANYRERRRKTLEELASKIAKNVLRSHRSTTLEPMNPYERRIIHSAIAEIEGVSSKSIGEDPYRKVVISSDEAPAKPPRRKNHDKNDKRHGKTRGRRDNKRNSDTPPSRISMDSMKTSFEKDYKRPKPEDDINAGLYGKIEF
ncbi:MAG: Jag N-terminal domain-containing protein [Oscillospiraceae bacterium]|nr:Jag N-terminal domain-containing protein [Oscillospiraceae bacterium]